MELTTPSARAALASAPKSEKLAYSIAEFSEATGLGRSFLYEEIRAGRLIAQKAGARTIVTSDNGKKYLASRPVIDTASDAAA